MLPVLLLHGALGAASQLTSLQSALSPIGDVQILEFSSHGHTPAQPAFGIEAFAHEVLAFLADHHIATVNIFGYSMGGYVALYLARHYPEKVAGIVTLATKLHWDTDTATREVGGLNPDKIRQKVPQFAASLEERHQSVAWPELMDRTAKMMLDMGAVPPLAEDDFKAINTPTRLLLGDRDKMVSLDETLATYRALPHAQMGMLPGTPHPIESVDTSLLALHISTFFTKSSH